MKTTWFFFIGTCLCLSASLAQEAPAQYPRLGIGITLIDPSQRLFLEEFGAGTHLILSIQANQKLRIEPSLGAIYADGQALVAPGIGVLGVQPVKGVNILYGIRGEAWLGDWLSTHYYFAAPTLGGEYFFAERVSVSGELQAKVLYFDGEIAAFTNALVILRYFIF